PLVRRAGVAAHGEVARQDHDRVARRQAREPLARPTRRPEHDRATRARLTSELASQNRTSGGFRAQVRDFDRRTPVRYRDEVSTLQRSLLGGGEVRVDDLARFERIELDETAWIDVARGWL